MPISSAAGTRPAPFSDAERDAVYQGNLYRVMCAISSCPIPLQRFVLATEF